MGWLTTTKKVTMDLKNITSVLLSPQSMRAMSDTLPPTSAMTRWKSSVKKTQLQTPKKIPKTICKKIVDTIFIEECEEIIRTVCDESHEQYFSSQHIAGHESEKVAHYDSAHEEYHKNSYHV